MPNVCTFCEKEVDANAFCYGCRENVCKGCNTGGFDLPFGGHDVEDHQPEEDEDE